MTPSRAQLRMLHVLTRGTLVFKNWPYPKFEIPTEYSLDESWHFHPATARLIVERNWAELRKFDSLRGEYGLTVDGLALANEFCECPGRRGKTERSYWAKRIEWNFEKSTEILAGRLLCVRCGRRVRCVSRKTEPHGASRWHRQWGPVCEKHP